MKNLNTPGLSVRDVFDKTQEDVEKASSAKQRPELRSSFSGGARVYLGGGPKPSQTQNPTPTQKSLPVPVVNPEPTLSPWQNPLHNATVEDAKATANKLGAAFTFEKKITSAGASAINAALSKYLNEMDKTFAEKKMDVLRSLAVGKKAEVPKKPDFWHSLNIELRQGELYSSSLFMFNGKNNLYHTRLSVTIDGETRGTELVLDVYKAPLLKGSFTIEDAQILDMEILRFIANNPNKKIVVQIEGNSGLSKTYTLSPIAQRAIAETLELMAAHSVLKEHGVEIRPYYF